MKFPQLAEQYRKKVLLTGLLVLFAVLQYFIWLGDHGFARLWRLEQTVANQHDENLTLQTRNQQLHAEVKDLKHGSEALEERARSELGLVKPDETFYQVIEPRGGDPSGR